MKQLFESILQNENIRSNLSLLRQEIKNASAKQTFAGILIGHESYLISLLQNEDAKTRKNAALLMGDMGELGFLVFLEPLFHAYVAEQQLFVKSSYLTALRSFPYDKYLPDFEKRLEELASIIPDDTSKKHIEEEMSALTSLILSVTGISTHTFTGYEERYECILLTNRLHSSVTEEQIEDALVKPFPAGLQVTTRHIEDLLPIRTYQELLFVVSGMKTCEGNPEAAAKKVALSYLPELLKKSHSGEPPFYFRIEMKTKMPLDKKSAFVKKMSRELERYSNRMLLNSTSNYEVEIRLIETKEGDFNMLVKLYTLPDTRFTYKTESIATGIKPVNAALLVALARPYMIEDARVLDPFCGVGTLLIERQKVVKGNTSYGIDILHEAIEKARINTESAGQIIHYINKDFFQFEHEYLFDEIFTDLPFAIGHKTEDEIYDLYEDFFSRAKSHLTKEGTLILYTRNPEYIFQFSKEKDYVILKHWEIGKKEGTYLFVLKPEKTKVANY